MESSSLRSYVTTNSCIPQNSQLGETSAKRIIDLIDHAEVITLHKDTLPERELMRDVVKQKIDRFGYTIRITNSEGYGNITGGIMLLERLLELNENLKIKLSFDEEVDPVTGLTASQKFDKLCAGNERMTKVLVNEFDDQTLQVIGLTGMGDINYTEKDQVILNAETLSLMSNCNTFLHLQPYGYKHSSRAIYLSKSNSGITIAKFGDDLKEKWFHLFRQKYSRLKWIPAV